MEGLGLLLILAGVVLILATYSGTTGQLSSVIFQ